MNLTVSLLSLPLLVIILFLSTIFSSGIGTATAQEYSVIATIPVGQGPLAIAVNPTNGLVYVANFDLNTVSVIDPSTNTVVDTIPVGQGPAGVAFNPTNGLVYVANFGSNTVSVISTVSQPPPPGGNTQSSQSLTCIDNVCETTTCINNQCQTTVSQGGGIQGSTISQSSTCTNNGCQITTCINNQCETRMGDSSSITRDQQSTTNTAPLAQ
jgi:YVTN family beta-propeller protein